MTSNLAHTQRHNVTLADGPFLAAASKLRRPARYATTLLVAGMYKLCYLHPVTMTQVISVRPAAEPLPVI